MAARRIPPNTSSQTGAFWSRKNGGVLVDTESLLEWDYCVNLEFDEAVRTYRSQPDKISYRRGRRKCTGFPDFEVTLADDLLWIVDVTTESRLRSRWDRMKPRLRAACAYARSRSGIYHIRLERHIRTPFLDNCRQLLRFLRDEPDPVHAQVFLNAIATLDRATFQDLLDSCYSKVEQADAVRTLWVLIAHREIACNFELPMDNITFELWHKEKGVNEKIA